MHLRLPALQLCLFLFIQVLFLAITNSALIPIIKAQEGGVAPGETLQTNPKPRKTTVTARVPDLQPPNTPILINPENNSIINTNRPTFIWEIEDNGGEFGLQDFDLYLDGQLLFANIPIYSVDTNLYTLTYNPTTHRYSLVPKNSLADGLHTWKVVARDTNNNTSTSVTWSFTIDTTAPYLILNQIGSTPTSVSSQDLSTVPTTPIIVYETNPLLKGIGEAGASVELTLRFSNGQADQIYTFTINPDGTWQVQLNNLPLDLVMYLDFVITDGVGNVAILSDVPFIVRSRGTQPLPSVIPTPGPSQPPEEPGPFPIPLPSPLPSIPNPFEPLPLPFPFELFTRGFLEKIRPVTDTILLDNFIVLLMIISILLTRLLLIVWPLKSLVSLSVIRSAVTTLFFIPFSKKIKRGLVFDHETGRPVPYATIQLFHHQDTHTKQETTFFTDKNGLFYYLPKAGIYSLSIEQPTCLFPTTYIRPNELPIEELYKGEQLCFTKDTYPTLFIPVNRYEDVVYTRRERFLITIQLVDSPSNLLLFSLAVILTLIFPTLINIVTTALYLLVLLVFYLDKRRHDTKATIYDISKNPIQFVICKVKIPKTDTIVDFDASDQNGNIIVEIPVDEYIVDAYKLHWEITSVELPVVLLKQTV